MPRGAVDDDHHLPARAPPFGPGEGCECQAHRLRADCGHEEPGGLATLGMDEAVRVSPFIAVRADCERALPAAGPDLPDEGVESAPGLSVPPDLNAGPTIGGS
jgi:hypothetical protein